MLLIAIPASDCQHIVEYASHRSPPKCGLQGVSPVLLCCLALCCAGNLAMPLSWPSDLLLLLLCCVCAACRCGSGAHHRVGPRQDQQVGHCLVLHCAAQHCQHALAQGTAPTPHTASTQPAAAAGGHTFGAKCTPTAASGSWAAAAAGDAVAAVVSCRGCCF